MSWSCTQDIQLTNPSSSSLFVFLIGQVSENADQVGWTPGKGTQLQLLQSSAYMYEIGHLAIWGIQKSQGLDCSCRKYSRFEFGM